MAASDHPKPPDPNFQPTPPIPSGPRVVLPPSEMQEQIREFETAAPVVTDQRPVFGFIMAMIFGLIGSIIWAAFTWITKYELGLIAIVVGVLAGVGARKGGLGRRAQWTGAICAAIAYFIGQSMVLFAYVVKDPRFAHRGQNAAVSKAPASSQESDDDEAEKQDAPKNSASDDEKEASAEPDARSGEKPVDIKTFKDFLWALGIVFGTLLYGSVIYTFQSMGVLFLGIAVYEGWRIPRAV